MSKPDYYTVQNELLFTAVSRYADYIIIHNVVHVFHKYNLKVLTSEDVNNLKLKSKKQTHVGAARDLLDVLKRYDGWYLCLLKVLRDEQVKQDHVAIMIEEEVCKLKKQNSQVSDQVQNDCFKVKTSPLECEGERDPQKLEETGNINKLLAQKMTEIITLSAQIQGLTKELQCEREKNTHLHEGIQSLTKELHCETGKNAHLYEEIQGLTKELQKKKYENVQFHEEIQDLKRDMSKKDREIHELKNNIGEKDLQILALRDHMCKKDEDLCRKIAMTEAEEMKVLDRCQEVSSSSASAVPQGGGDHASQFLSVPSLSDQRQTTSEATSNMLAASNAVLLPPDIMQVLFQLVELSGGFYDPKKSVCAGEILKSILDDKNEPYRSVFGDHLADMNYAETIITILSLPETDARNSTVLYMFAIWSMLSFSSDRFAKNLADKGTVKGIVVYLCNQEANDKDIQQAVLYLILVLHNIAVTIGPSSCFMESQTAETLQVYVRNQNKSIRKACLLTLAHILEKEQKQQLKVDTDIIQDILQSICKMYFQRPQSSARCTSKDEFFPAQRLLLGLAQLALNEDNAHEIIKRGALKDFTHLLETGKPIEQFHATLCVRNLARHKSVQRKGQFCQMVPTIKRLLDGMDENLKESARDTLSVLGVRYTFLF